MKKQGVCFLSQRVLCTAFAAVAALLIIIAVLFTSLQICMNQENWYYESYVKYGTAKDTLISEKDMTRAIFRLIDYMEGRVDDIQLTVSENGQQVEMYNQQEIEHMVDVRALYQAWRAVRDYGTIAAAVLLIISIIMLKKGERMHTICRGFIIAAGVFMLVLVALGIWVAVDFNSFWTEFHHLFFTNDLWLMDYATCRMIRICPLQLFNDIVVRFALIFLIPFAAMVILAALGIKRSRK